MLKTNFKNDFDVWKNYVNKIGEMLLNDEYLINENFQKDENYKTFKEIFENKFIKYKTNERFFIPIIGIISSGKSTFLNSIIQGDYLSSSSGSDTKLFCILRNNNDCNAPILYKCQLIKEKIDYKYNDNIVYYYFEKTNKEAEGENILKKIKIINEDLKKYEERTEIKERDINKYFYLLELKIPLFDNNDLGDFFDLVDIPGLNEKGDFYLNYIIPFLLNKCLFSIYIFNAEKYENKDTYRIYADYSKQLNKYYNTNSIYILNKIDYVSDENEKNIVFDKFKKFLNSELNVDLEKNIILKLNSKKIFNKANAFSALNTFILSLADKFEAEEKEDENQDFFDYIKDQFTTHFKIDKEEIEKIFNDEGNNFSVFDEKEYNDIFNNLTVRNFPIEFNEDDYQKMKYIFTNKEPSKQSNQIPVYEEIYKAMKNNLNDFFNWKNIEELIKSFKKFMEKSFTNENEAKTYINMCNELIKSFKKELDLKSKLEKTKFNVKILDSF